MNTKPFTNIFFLFLSSLLMMGTQLSAHSTEHKIKKEIDSIAESCKSAVQELGSKVDDIQKYLDNYTWKGLIQDRVTFGPETLSNLKLNGHNRIAVVRRGEQIQATVNYTLDENKAAFFNNYRIVVGLKWLGPQTTFGRRLGVKLGETTESFTLAAPLAPGFYEVRFRAVDCFLESSALAAWYDDEGKEPDANSTIGIVYVTP